jgi:CelD/BcsL family acetyltransferase involved in cellulose biosynthesis
MAIAMTDRIETLRIAELDVGQVARWRELAARAIQPNPFAEAEFVLPASEHLADGPDRLLVVADADGWRACLPLARTRIRALTRADEAGVRRYGFLSTPLVDSDEPERYARLLVAACTDRRDPVRFASLASTGPFHAALQAAARSRDLQVLERQEFDRALLVRDAEPLGERLGTHHRREYRRQGRRLAEELGAELSCDDRAGDPAAIERFMELEKSGWKGRAGTAFASNPSDAEFFREVCRTFHAAGRLQLLDLGSGGRSAAMKCNLAAGEGSFAFKIAFDETLARWSPGIQLELRNIDVFESGAARWMDSCASPENAMINRLWPERRPLTTVLLATGQAANAGARASLAATRRLRDAKRVGLKAFSAVPGL